MKILIISGSRNPEGRTALLIKSLQKGISTAGGESECLFLPQMKIERCRQCNSDGWGICRSEHRCIIEDDFAGVVEKIKAADLVVFATPVYFADLSESLRSFLDRLRRTRFVLGNPAARGMPFTPAADSTPAIGICYAGGSGNGTTSCAANLERILQTCGFDVVDMINARRQNLEAKLPVMEIVGSWLVTKPSSLKSKLEPR
jgi:NAD(P)H-dependent FMN reductase